MRKPKYNIGDKIRINEECIMPNGELYKLQQKLGGALTVRSINRSKECSGSLSRNCGGNTDCQLGYRFVGDEDDLVAQGVWCNIETRTTKIRVNILKPPLFDIKTQENV